VKAPSSFRTRLREQLDDPRKKDKWQIGFYLGLASTICVPIAVFGLLSSGWRLVDDGTWSTSDYVQRAIRLIIIGGVIFTINAAFGILSYRQLRRLGELGPKEGAS